MKKGLQIFGIIIGAICLIILIANWRDGIATLKPVVDLYAEETDITKLSTTQAVEADIYMALDYFATETTTRTRDGNFVSRDNDYYFIIPAFSEDELYFIGIRVNDKDFKTYSAISDDTYNYLMGISDNPGTTTVFEEGGLKKLDDKMYQYMVEWFQEAQWFEDEADIDKYVLPIYIDPYIINAARILFIVGVAGTLIGILCAVLLIKGNKKQKDEAQAQTMVTIGGMSFPKSSFSGVDRFVSQREVVFAMQELRNITGISAEEAKEVIDNWSSYYLK